MNNPRIYNQYSDHAGLGYPHQLVAWNDDDGTPRSIVIEMPDTNRAKWEQAEALLEASLTDLERFAKEGNSDEHQGAHEMALKLDRIIDELRSPVLLGNRPR